ncbi:MAG: hypothetical protein IT348_01705 [Candidatus Eisenbacteria bacterium]|nr:hypothetical protein [Candidatus Eisenbacteria bacterium]
MKRPAIPDVLAECLEELGFLDARLLAMTFSPDVPERRLPEHVRRGDGWRDCLAQQPEDTLRIAEEWLEEKRPPWLHGAAAWAWLTYARPDSVALAVRVQDVAAEQVPDWRQALRGRPVDPAWASEAARAERPTVFRHLLLDALGWNGALTAKLLEQAAADPEPLVRWCVARHAPAYAGAAAALCRDLCDDADAGVSRQARYSLCLLDPAAGVSRARRAADALDVWLLGHFGNDACVAPLEGAAAALPEAAPAALADLGTRAACAALVRMGEPGVPALATMLGDRPATVEAWDAAARGAAAVLQGKPRPWADDAQEEPMLFRWRASLAPGGSALRRVIPPGVVSGEPGVMEPGS